MKILVRWIKQDDSPIRKQPRKQQSKRASQSFPWTIRLTQPSRNLTPTQQRKRTLDHRLNFPPKLNRSYERVDNSLTLHRKKFRSAVRRSVPHMIDLSHIVVFCSQPKNWNAVNTGS